MAIYVGVGTGNSPNAYQSGYDASKEAISMLDAGKPDIFFAFISSSIDQEEALRGIRVAGENAPIAGCSSAGEITANGMHLHSVVVLAVKSDVIRFVVANGGSIAGGARISGAMLAKQMKAGTSEALRLAILFPDILSGNGAEVVRGVLDVMGAHFPLVGGAASDDFLFKKTYQYESERMHSGSVVGVGISGNFTIGIGVRHGWIPIGVPMKVTKSRDAVLYELDGEPAINIYKEYFGEISEEFRAEPLAHAVITYPLGIKMQGADEYLVRDPMFVRDDGSIVCGADIPEGTEVRLMIGSKETAIEAAAEAARSMMKEFEIAQTVPKFVLMFNSIAREKLLGEKANDEIRAVRDIINRRTPLAGFYTYGEIAPIGGEMRDIDKLNSIFLNETIVIVGIG